MSDINGIACEEEQCLDSSFVGACLGAAAYWPPAAGDTERAQSHRCLYQNQGR